jgi:hypothetical protein
MTSPHDIFVLALAEESVRLIHAFANFPPVRLQVPDLPKSAEVATRRPSFHIWAPRRGLQNLEGEKVLLHQYVRKVQHAIYGVLAGQSAPLVLAAEEPLASMFRSLNTYPRLTNEMIEGNPENDNGCRAGGRRYPDSRPSLLPRTEGGDRALRRTEAAAGNHDVSYAAHAATAGAIEQLLVDLDAVIPGLVSDIDGSVITLPSTKSRGARCIREPG